MNPRVRPEKQQLVRGRRRARITMRTLTILCAAAGLGIGAFQLVSNGFGTFVDRPAGVGATPDDAPAAAPAARGRQAPQDPNTFTTPTVPEPQPDHQDNIYDDGFNDDRGFGNDHGFAQPPPPPRGPRRGPRGRFGRGRG